MARINITPEQVRQAAGQFQQAGQQSQEMVTHLTQTMNGMQPEWEGMTAQRFYSDFQQWQGSMRQFVELLESIGQQLNQIADRFAGVDGQ